MKTHALTDVPAIGDPGLRAEKENGKYHILVDTDLSIFSGFCCSKCVCIIFQRNYLPLRVYCHFFLDPCISRDNVAKII